MLVIPLSCCTKDTPLLKFDNCCAVAWRDEQYELSLQLGLLGPPEPTATGEVSVPLQKSVSPLIEVTIGTSPPGLYWEVIRSAIRPAQPVLPEESLIWFCHSSCWSG